LIEEIRPDPNAVLYSTLKILQKSKEPLLLEDLLKKVEEDILVVEKEDILDALEILTRKGYDIKEITKGRDQLFVLIRTPSLAEEEMYRIHGSIETPLIVTGDFHIGSKGFYKIAFDQMLKDIERFRINDVLLAGDLLQGRGVYKTEMADLSVPGIGDQLELASRHLEKIDARVHLVTGNHEEKIKGSIHIGLDVLKILSKSLDNTFYYSSVAQFTLNDEFRYMMMHGGGTPTEAASYRVEKIWRELYFKPNVLHTGHIHQKVLVEKGVGKFALSSGTLQRTSSWLLAKGVTAKVGWFILLDIPDPESWIWIWRSPQLR
jgi:hypothetical protein